MSEKKEQTFESAVKDLEKIVSELESGELDLDKSIEKYTEAMKLIQSCEKKLNAATKTVNKLVIRIETSGFYLIYINVCVFSKKSHSNH
jgi:exodeoxyribonuclease VII small subunit